MTLIELLLFISILAPGVAGGAEGYRNGVGFAILGTLIGLTSGILSSLGFLRIFKAYFPKVLRAEKPYSTALGILFYLAAGLMPFGVSSLVVVALDRIARAF